MLCTYRSVMYGAGEVDAPFACQDIARQVGLVIVQMQDAGPRG